MLTDLTAYIDGSASRTTAVTAVLAGQVVRSSSDGPRPALSLFAAHAVGVLGMAETSAAQGEPLLIVTEGVWRGTTPWPVGAPLFLGPDGYPTTDPGTGAVCLPLGHVKAPGQVHVRIGLPIVHGGT